MKKLKVLIADDHPIVLLGVRQILSDKAEFLIVGEANQAGDLLRLIEEKQPDIVITDYDMPGDETHGDGLRFIGYLRRHYPQINVIILTVVQSAVIISMLQSMGVFAVLSKIEDMGEILRALRFAQLGLPYRGPSAEAQGPGVAENDPAAERIAQLTGKELEVLRHLMGGSSVTVVATTLQRSVKTISAQKISAMRKLGVTSDHELVMFCLQHKLFGSI